MKRITFFLFGVFLLIAETDAQITLSGAELLNDACPSFYNATPSQDGNSLVIISTGDNQPLMIIPIIEPGEIQNGTDISCSLQIDYTQRTIDNDPVFGFVDGGLAQHTNLAYSENTVTHWYGSGPLNINGGNSFFDSELNPCSGSCTETPGQNALVDLQIDIVSNIVTLTITTTMGATSATSNHTFAETYNVNEGISFMFGLNSTSESGQINSITFNDGFCGKFDTAPIPTLSQWGIIALGMLTMIFGVVMIRQRKTIFA